MTEAPRTILFLHPSAELYGADRTLLQLVEGLDRRRWRAVVALPRRGPLGDALGRAGATVEVGELGIGARASLSLGGLLMLTWKVPRGAWRVLRMVRRHRPSLVHTNTIVVLGGALGARLSGVPHLWHVHEILGRPRWLARLFARTVAVLSDRAVSNSAATRWSMDRRYPPLRLRHDVVLNGVEGRGPCEEGRRGAVRRELGVPDRAPLVLLVGRVNSWKGQGLLVEAARRLADRHPDARYVLAGDAPPGQPRFEADLDEAIRASGLEARVLRVPFWKDVTSLYEAADLCVVPSTRPEPFGLVVAESMERGRPVIAADHGGLAEVVVPGETGLLFTPGDVDALTAALDELLSDPARARRMGDAGRRRQRARFTVERYVAEMEEQYARLSEPAPRAVDPLPRDTRIIHLSLGKANPHRSNGVNRVVHHLASAQARAGRRVEFWGLTPTPHAPAGPRPYPVRMFHRGRVRLRLDPVLVAMLRSLEAPAVVHVHGGLLPEMARVAGHLRRRGIPYVFTPHGTYRPEALAKKRWRKRLVIALFDRPLLAGARAVQAFAASDAGAIGRFVTPTAVTIVPNGQDLLAPAPDGAGNGGERRRPIFGFCGRLTAHTKGLDLLLDGFAGHVADGGAGVLWIIGEGPDRAALEERARARGISDRVVFQGAHFGEEKLVLLRRLDAFVHPSRHEGMPGAVLEAAAIPLPLLVSEGTNLGDPVREFDAGLVIEDGDPQAVRQALSRIAEAYASDGLEVHAAGARRMVLERFTWKHVESRLARDLYGLEPSPSSLCDAMDLPRRGHVPA